MKLYLAVLVCCFVYVQCQLGHHGGGGGGFLFDSLFSSGCKLDSECGHNGCCVIDDFGHHRCWHHTLDYLHQCHLNRMETHSCGCGPGLYCEKIDHLSSGSIALEGSFNSGMGVCEHDSNYTTTEPPMIAVEGGR